MKDLYCVRNIGCDDETIGLAIIPDEYFPQFKKNIENLNKNSTYGCQPTIFVYKITMDDLREATYEDLDYKRLYLDDKVYVLTKDFYEMECVINDKN